MITLTTSQANEAAAPCVVRKIHQHIGSQDYRMPAGSIDKQGVYRRLSTRLSTVFGSERDPISNAANTGAALFHWVPDVSWAGFFFVHTDDELLLGPFHGNPVGSRISIAGTTAGAVITTGQSFLTDDSNKTGVYAPISAEGRSELIVPLMSEQGVFGILCVAANETPCFDEEDLAGIETIARTYVNHCTWKD